MDWSHFHEEQPTGMTVALYPRDAALSHQAVLSNFLDYVDVSLQRGSYDVLAYNQSTTEFGSLHFENMDDFLQAQVLANTYTSTWYRSRTDEERTAKNPEWFAVGGLDSITVTKDMIGTKNMTGEDSLFVTDTITPHNIIHTLHIRIHVKGIYNIRSARASIDGMAEGYQFASRHVTSSVITQLIEKWNLTADKDNPTNGTLTATIQTFGLPFNHQGKEKENLLRLSLLLVDNKTQKDYDFEVGDKFKASDEELDLSLDLNLDTPIPDVKPEGGSSGGFDATVEDWGDDINIDINA